MITWPIDVKNTPRISVRVDMVKETSRQNINLDIFPKEYKRVNKGHREKRLNTQIEGEIVFSRNTENVFSHCKSAMTSQ